MNSHVFILFYFILKGVPVDYIFGLMLSSGPDETAEKGSPMPTSKAKLFHAIPIYP